MKKIFFLLWGLTYSAFASEYIPCTNSERMASTCFDCGETCVARYTTAMNDDGTTKGTLTISGTGDMDDTPYYVKNDNYRTSAPWQDIAGNIQSVVIEEGITSVGERNFYRLAVQDVSFPESLQKIGLGAFQQTDLRAVELPSHLESVGHAAFATSYFDDLVVPESVLEAGTHAFGSSTLKSLTIEGNLAFQKNMLFDSMSTISSQLNAIYCEKSNESCLNLLKDKDIGSKIKFYEPKGSQYLYNGKFYASPADIAGGNYAKKRIYTIDEASSVAGKKNKVMLKYK